VDLIANNDVVGFVIEFLNHTLDLVQTVSFVIDRHQQRQPGFEDSENRSQVNRFEVTQKDFGRCGTTVHNDHICSFEGAEHLVQQSRLIEVKEAGVGMKSLQGGILVVGIARHERYAVFEELDEVHGEETLPTPPLPLRMRLSWRFIVHRGWRI
jgi:hypothetical protein